ncbi:MAG: NUDIX domain-containing protein [Chloroflexi bacterium]|nr:NUDIX domain-containing protein [Chloroflexota bacterium]
MSRVGSARAADESAGAVVYYRGEEIKYLLLLSTYWGFPKGMIEAHEDERAAALREIREETGLEVNLVSGFRKVDDYWYQRRGQRIHKQAIYFLAEARSETVQISWEHEDWVWLTLDEALGRLKFKGLRDLLVEANEFMNNQKGAV